MNGRRYFETKPKFGVFVDEDLIGDIKEFKTKYRVEDVVETKEYGIGKIKFVGTIPEAPDCIMYGIHLDDKKGGHDGRINGRRYFDSSTKRGVFVTENLILGFAE